VKREPTRTIRALWWGWKAALSSAAEYRVDMVTGTIVSTFWLGIAVAPMLVVSANSAAAPGWTLPRLLFLQAVWYLMDGLLWMIALPNAWTLSGAVRDGELDATLLKPVDSLVLCTLGRLEIQDAPKIVLGVALGVGAMAAGGGPATPLAALGTVIAIGCALCLLWSVTVLTHYKAITQVEFDGSFALHAVHNLARVPTPLYGPVLHVLLTVVVPVAFLTTIPAQILFGELPPVVVVACLAVAILAIQATAVLWRRELRHYTGAMS